MITAVASGGVEGCHISVLHRYFSRATWRLDGVGRVACWLTLRWIPADQPLFVLIKDPLARKTGKGVALATRHRDPLPPSARKPVFSFGQVWVVLALWVPLPMGVQRGFALPLLFRPYVGAKRGGTNDAPGPPSTRDPAASRRTGACHAPVPDQAGARPRGGPLVADWADGRAVYAVIDSACAARPLLEGRPAFTPTTDAAWMSRTEFRVDRTVAALTYLAALHEKTGERGHAINEATEAEKPAQQLDLLAESQVAAVLLHGMQTRPCPVRVDVEQGLGELNGLEVRLDPFAVELLALLSEKQGERGPHAEIRARLWPGNGPASDALPEIYVLVHDIREAIKRHVPGSVDLVGVCGGGYRLIIPE